MEKITNLQVQGNVPVKSAVRQAQGAGSGDDFMKLLWQKQEPVQPESSRDRKDTRKTQDTPLKEASENTAPAEEQPEKEEELQDVDLQQLEQLQQSILQQTVVQPEIMEPVVQAGTDAAEALTVAEVAAETVQEVSGEIPLKTPEVSGQNRPEAAVPEADVKEAVPEQVADRVAEMPQSSRQEADTAFMPGESSPKAAEQRKDDPEQTVAFQETPAVHESVQTQNQTIAGTQNRGGAEQVKETFTVQEGTGGQAVKSTVEELPQELVRVWPSRNSGDSHVLTVELEPASLGKLTIRLEYEAGRAAVSIMASNPRTLELLNEKASELAGILKEHTGEETVVYTQQPEREPGEDAQEQQSRGGQQQERQHHREEGRQETTESFMQQLRLGLV